jgi:lysophospholipase L1-like esterase
MSSRSSKRRRSRKNRSTNRYAVIGFVLAAAVGLFAVIALINISSERRASVAAEIENYVPSGVPTEEADTRPVVAFIGDSYTQGVGASSTPNRWSGLVSASKDWNEYNFGRGGTGFVTTSDANGCGLAFCPNYQEMVADAVSSTPAIVVIAGGQNDFALWANDEDEENAAIAATYLAVREALPNARIIAVGPSTQGPINATVVGFDADVQAAAASVGATYVSLIDPNVIDVSYLIEDGAHVNDVGHAAIASRVLTAIG